jgi:hypothetical protein
MKTIGIIKGASVRRCLTFNQRFTSSLKITRIQAFQVDLPLHEGKYTWADGKSIEVFDATIVKIETNQGLVGYGEQTPLGPGA